MTDQNQDFKNLKFLIRQTLSHLDIDLLQIALSKDGRITPAIKEVLVNQGIPDILLEALNDGVIDDQEIQQLERKGIPKNILLALRDGQLTDAEVKLLKAQLTDQMKKWQEEKLRDLLQSFEAAYARNRK